MEKKKLITTGLMVCCLAVGMLVAGPLGNAYGTERGDSTQQWNCCPKGAQAKSNCFVMSGSTESSKMAGSDSKRITPCCERCSKMKPDGVAWERAPAHQENPYVDLLF